MSQTYPVDDVNLSWFNLENIFKKSGSFIVFSNLCKDLGYENELNFLKRALTFYTRFNVTRPQHNHFKQQRNMVINDNDNNENNDNNNESKHNCNFYNIDISRVFDDRWDVLLMEHELIDSENINKNNYYILEQLFVHGKTNDKFRIRNPISSKIDYLERLWDIHLNNIDNNNDDVILQPIHMPWQDYSASDPRCDICDIIDDKSIEDEEVDALFAYGGAMTQCIEIATNKLITQVLRPWKSRVIQNKEEIALWSKYFAEKYDIWGSYGSHLQKFGYYDKRNNWINLRLN